MNSILKFSEACTLAIHAMAIMALRPERTFTNKELADLLHASADHLTKVLHRLAKAQWITATRGPKGGFHLLKKAGAISLMDIYETIEGKFIPCQCLMQYALCHTKHCVFGTLLGQVNTLFYEHLTKTTLDQIHIPLVLPQETEQAAKTSA